MDIPAIQAALRDASLDAWLFYDHHHRDPLAYSILGLDPASNNIYINTQSNGAWQDWQQFQLSGDLVTGYPTAPSGPCTAVGWMFSQDGHATFCNGTNWVAKI